MDEFEKRKRLANFIGLQVADEMPPQSPGQLGNLRDRLLHSVLAEQILPRLDGLKDHLGWMGFGNGDKANIRGGAPRPEGGCAYLLPDGFKIFGNGMHDGVWGNLWTWDFAGGRIRLCSMHLEGFKVFCDLCDTGNFSRAAEASGITQSAVSQQIRAVEKRFGVPLLDRSRSGFALTPEGKIYLEVCRDILSRWDSLGSRFRVARGKLGGKLRVASVISIALHDLPPLLKQFRKNHPGVEVTVDYRRDDEIYDAVGDGRADIGLVAYPRARPGIRAMTCWQERLVLVMPPRHPLKGKRPLAISQLEGERFVGLVPETPTRQNLDRALRKAGVKVQIVAEVENIETVKAAVEAEQAISIIPETSLRQEIRQGTLCTRQLDADRMWRSMGAVTRRPIPEKPALLEFLTLLTPRAKALLPIS